MHLPGLETESKLHCCSSTICSLLFLLFPAFLLLFPSPVFCSNNSYISPVQSEPKSPWHLKADKIEADQDQKIAEAYGNVLIWNGGNRVSADYAKYFWETNWVFLQGNVNATIGKDIIHAQEAEFDLKNNVGWLNNGQIFVQESNLYFKGKRLEKKGPSTYTFKDAQVTACDGPNPAWSLKTSQGEITVEGYARLWHPRFQIKNFPVLYVPFMALPAKRKRQSGFLLPEYSSSTIQGTSISLPYYQVINEEQDLTFYFRYMSKRGPMLGAEYRLTPNLDTKGLFRADWFKDRETSDTVEEEFDQFDEDQLIRSNEHRYWLRGKYNGYLFQPSWQTKLDLDLVSDQNYLREFDSGYSGFDESREVFLQYFGRDIDDKDDLTRENILSLSKNWSYYGLESRLEYTQNLNFFNDNHLTLQEEENDTLQRIPEINFDVYQHDLLNTFLDWEAENELTYFWRRSGTKGTRMDLHPQVSWPIETIYSTIIPKVGWRQTIYNIDRYENTASEVDTDNKFQSRGIWDFNTRIFSEVYNIFNLSPDNALQATEENLGKSVWSKIKHSLQPEIEYNFIPDQDQQELPNFDSTDRIEPENELTYSLTNIFTSRKDSVINAAGKEGTNFKMKKDYLDFLRIKVQQSYDFEEADRDKDLDRFPRRPFTDIRTEITFEPTAWLYLDSSTWISPYLWDITEHEHILQLRKDDRASLYFSLDFLKELDEDIHRKNQEALNILKTGGKLKINPNWLITADYQRDLAKGELIEERLGLSYQQQCWGARIEFMKDDHESSIAVYITLRQLGEFGEEIAIAEETE